MNSASVVGVEAQRFADLAQRYRELIDQRGIYSMTDLLSRVQVLLGSLYAAAATLPKVDGSEKAPELRITEGEWQGVLKSLQSMFGSRTHYREVFDPYDQSENEPVTADLADDLADVYRDLREGLDLWAAGYKVDAVWAWRESFRSHWGEHATGALRAIYTLAYRK